MTVPGVPRVFIRAQNRSWLLGLPTPWNPTCGRVPEPERTVYFQPWVGSVSVTLSVVLLCCSRLTVPAGPTVKVSWLPTPGAGGAVTLLVPHVGPAPGDAPTGVAAH